MESEYLGQRTVTIAEAEAISRTASGFMVREPSPLLEQNEIEDLDLKEMDINFDEVMMETGLHGPLMHDLDDLKPDSSDSISSPPHISSSAYLHQFSSPEDKHLSRITSSGSGKAGRGKKKMPPFRCRVWFNDSAFNEMCTLQFARNLTSFVHQNSFEVIRIP